MQHGQQPSQPTTDAPEGHAVVIAPASPMWARHDGWVRAQAERRVAEAAGARGDAAADTARARAGSHGAERMSWGGVCEIPARFDSVEVEYAAIRRDAALVDFPQRGTLEVTGAERVPFLQRMLTQDLKPLQAAPGAVQAFWLNRKGRIDADMLVVDTGDRMLVELDAAVAPSVAASLVQFVFSEDVQVIDATDRWARFEIHGPGAIALLDASGVGADASLGMVHARRDLCGVPGIACAVPRDRADEAWSRLLAAGGAGGAGGAGAGADPGAALAAGRQRARPCGWLAFNMARIEGGSPIFMVDFGTASLPHETSLIDSRVSFTKGCYLGQEVVARMQSLGKPKQVIVAFKATRDALPAGGAQVFTRRDDGGIGDEVGVVTSSTLSPMLGAAPVGLATVRTAQSAAGTTLVSDAEGELVEIVVQPALCTLPGARPAR
ncbi:MAG: aminomethyl transferase family protein [Phycisphaerales bacterium]|nr:aminomethyl transferase family protein [Phycisphaerales bacterium]